MRSFLIAMCVLAVASVATAATPLATNGRFLLVGETDRELRMIDDSRTTREGSMATARLLTALAAAQPYPTGGEVRVFEHFVTYDCSASRQRMIEGAAAGGDFLVRDRRQYPDEAWSPIIPQTASATTFSFVCRGAQLPAAGADFAALAQAYWRARII